MPCLICGAIVFFRTDNDRIAITTECDSFSGVIVRCLTVNITAELIPTPTIPAIDPCVARVTPIAVVAPRTDRDRTAIVTECQ